MLRIVRDEPGRVLELAWEGRPPRLWERLALPPLWLGLFGLSGAAVAALWSSSRTSFTPASDNAYALAVGGLILAVGGAALALVGRGMTYWRRLRFDAASGEASGERVDFLWLRREARLPLSQARGVTLSASGGRLGRGATLTALGPGDERWDVPLPGFDDRRRALGLLFAAARILRWPAYAIARSDALALEAALLTSLGPGAQPVPSRAEERPALPPLQAPPFVPASCGWRSRVEHWEPGALVELSTRHDAGAFWLLNVLGACFAFFVVFAALGLGYPSVAIGAALTLAFAVWVLVTQSPDPGPIRARLDWKAGTARFWSGRFDRTVPLSGVDSLLLDGAAERVPDRVGDGSHTEYCIRLLAHAEHRYELLAEARLRPSPDDALLSAMAAALPLADKLGAALDFHDFPRLPFSD